MLRTTAAILLVTALLAGCAHKATPLPADDVPALEATASTGVIRAIVVDEAIRPLTGVNVTVLLGGNTIQTKATDATGFAGFEGIAPGTYFVKAVRRGYTEVQQAVDVVAGVSDPKVTKLQLAARVGNLAFYQEFKLEGFLECSATIGNWCFIANYYPCLVERTAGQPCGGNLTNDNSYFAIDRPVMDLNRIPDWMQVEMVWQSTQSVSPYLDMRLDFLLASKVTIDNATENLGGSPLLITVDQPDLERNGVGVNHSLAIETFHGGPSQACDNDPTQSGACLYGGAAVEQRFTDYVHIFYGYAPPEGWRFSTDGTVPQPP